MLKISITLKETNKKKTCYFQFYAIIEQKLSFHHSIYLSVYTYIVSPVSQAKLHITITWGASKTYDCWSSSARISSLIVRNWGQAPACVSYCLPRCTARNEKYWVSQTDTSTFKSILENVWKVTLGRVFLSDENEACLRMAGCVLHIGIYFF